MSCLKQFHPASTTEPQQATQMLLADNFTQWSIRLRRRRLRAAQRSIAQTLMRRELLVIDQIFGQDMSQMRFAEDDEVVQALAFARGNEASFLPASYHTFLPTNELQPCFRGQKAR
jgi:hypothetical protein